MHWVELNFLRVESWRRCRYDLLLWSMESRDIWKIETKGKYIKIKVASLENHAWNKWMAFKESRITGTSLESTWSTDVEFSYLVSGMHLQTPVASPMVGDGTVKDTMQVPTESRHATWVPNYQKLWIRAGMNFIL